MALRGRLYVLLHGLTVSQDSGNEIEVALPEIAGHVCKAGNWLRETPIERNSDLRLEGVVAGSTTVSALDRTIVLRGSSLARGPRSATLRLPRPAKIHQLLVSRTVIQTATIPPRGISPPGGVATLLVFQYRFRDENRVYLGPNAPSPPAAGHYWEPASTGGSISLHIVSTSEDWEGKQHDIDAQNVLGKVVTAYPGLVAVSRGTVPTWREPDLPPQWSYNGEAVFDGRQFAFAQAELEPINSRSMRLNWLGRTKQQGRPLENVWHEPEPLGDYPPVCGPMVCS